MNYVNCYCCSARSTPVPNWCPYRCVGLSVESCSLTLMRHPLVICPEIWNVYSCTCCSCVRRMHDADKDKIGYTYKIWKIIETCETVSGKKMQMYCRLLLLNRLSPDFFLWWACKRTACGDRRPCSSNLSYPRSTAAAVGSMYPSSSLIPSPGPRILICTVLYCTRTQLL